MILSVDFVVNLRRKDLNLLLETGVRFELTQTVLQTAFAPSVLVIVAV